MKQIKVQNNVCMYLKVNRRLLQSNSKTRSFQKLTKNNQRKQFNETDILL